MRFFHWPWGPPAYTANAYPHIYAGNISTIALHMSLHAYAYRAMCSNAVS